MTSRIVKRKRGSGHSYAIDGEPAPGVTTILGGSLPKPGLRYWYAKETAKWAATNAALLNGAMDEDDWVKMAASAPNRNRDKAALRGTSIHGYAQALLAGKAGDVPEEYAGPVEQAARFMERWDIGEVAAERPCANVTMRYAGTFDLIATMLGGELWLLDYKTGGIYADGALQLAAYAGCEIYQDESGNDQPMPVIDRLGVVALAEDDWQLIPIRAAWRDLYTIFLHCRHVAQFTEWTDGYPTPRWQVIGEPLPKPEGVAS